MTEVDRGIVSDILNSFIGAVFGAYMGILISKSVDLRVAAILFIVTVVSLCGAVSLHLESLIQGAVLCLSVWGFGIALSYFFPDDLPAVVMAMLTSTFWMWSFYPRIFNKWTGEE
jgi:hypothetical protein